MDSVAIILFFLVDGGQKQVSHTRAGLYQPLSGTGLLFFEQLSHTPSPHILQWCLVIDAVNTFWHTIQFCVKRRKKNAIKGESDCLISFWMSPVADFHLQLFQRWVSSISEPPDQSSKIQELSWEFAKRS